MSDQTTATPESNGGKTGWPPGLLQDDSRALSQWFARKPDARRCARETVQIITQNEPPPIPVRAYDWSATQDGYEPSDPIGFGPTEADAVADLKRQLEKTR